MDQMRDTAILTIFVIIAISLLQNRGENDVKKIALKKELLKFFLLFNTCSVALMILLVAVYSVFWK
jgi:SSS family solute:Na+ symporter